MRITIKCPICASRATARSSQELSITLREITYRCENDECGHIYIAQLEVVRTLVSSAIHNPAVTLPISKHVSRRESTAVAQAA